MIATQFSTPEDEFVKFVATRVYDGIVTQKVREQFAGLTRKAASQYLNDRINERLKSAMSSGVVVSETAEDREPPVDEAVVDPDSVVTTEEELEGFHIVKAIIRSVVDVKRITMRDTKSYCGILLDDNNRKPVCRLHFNRAQKYIGVFDKEKNETRMPIDSLDDIYTLSEELKDTAVFWGEL